MSIVAQARFNAAIELMDTVNGIIVAGNTEMDGEHFVVTEDAPDTLDGIRYAYAAAILWGHRLPVSPVGLEGSIYASARDNARFRAAHDCIHFRFTLPLTTEGELEAALKHCTAVARYGEALGYTQTTVRDAVALMWIDTALQAQYYAETAGGFVEDQRRFGIDRFIAYLQATGNDVSPVNIGRTK